MGRYGRRGRRRRDCALSNCHGLSADGQPYDQDADGNPHNRSPHRLILNAKLSCELAPEEFDLIRLRHAKLTDVPFHIGG